VSADVRRPALTAASDSEAGASQLDIAAPAQAQPHHSSEESREPTHIPTLLGEGEQAGTSVIINDVRTLDGKSCGRHSARRLRIPDSGIQGEVLIQQQDAPQ
jgi:hypothetical protein